MKNCNQSEITSNSVVIIWHTPTSRLVYTHPASGSTPSGIQTQPEAAPRQAYTPRQWQYPVRHTHVGGNYIMPCRSILALNAAIDSFAPLTTSLLGPLVQHLSTILSVCLSVCLLIGRSVYLSVCLLICLSIYKLVIYLVTICYWLLNFPPLGLMIRLKRHPGSVQGVLQWSRSAQHASGGGEEEGGHRPQLTTNRQAEEQQSLKVPDVLFVSAEYCVWWLIAPGGLNLFAVNVIRASEASGRALSGSTSLIGWRWCTASCWSLRGQLLTTSAKRTQGTHVSRT